MDGKNNENSKSKIESNYKIRSKSTIKYSSVSPSPNFVRHQCNTNLNLPPPNWLSDEAESYGLRYAFKSGFSSFQIANMFYNDIDGVDVVSDAENIKMLLKIPYSNKSISMMVHKVDDTLLIDEFDVQKHLMIQNNKWEWMRKFLNNHVIKSLEKKEKYITCKVNTFNVLQQKTLYSKFLHHSIADSLNSNQTTKQKVIDQPFALDPFLSTPTPDEAFPDDPNTHQQFNHYVSWHFEYLQMLLGTNLQIFKKEHRSNCFHSSRLRNISKPLSVSTAIDYWLDNLFCNIPEVVICYHLNGFVQKYESVNTENLPVLNNSNFSAEVIKNVAQNLISFLKANTSKSGHTYWLFKEKNKDEIKLYDLTSICFESSANGCDEGQNPFTVPVAMLLYRVAQSLNYNPTQKRPFSEASTKILLDNCLKILNKTIYPKIVTSAHYILSDVYLSHMYKPDCPKFSDLFYIKEEHVDPSYNWSLTSNAGKFVCCVNLNNLLLSQDNKIQSTNLKIVKFDERCKKALYHTACGLSCLENLKNIDLQNIHEEGSMVKENTDIDAFFDTENVIPSKVKKNKRVVNNGIKNKNRKHNKQDIDIDFDDSNISDVIFYQSIFKNVPSLHKPSDPNNSELWKQHLSVLFYKKANLSYAALAEYEFTCKNYGQALKYFYFSYECQMIINNNNPSNAVYGFLFTHFGDCCYNMALNWDLVTQSKNELQNNKKYNIKLWEFLRGNHDCTKYILEANFRSREGMLQAAEFNFLQSLRIETNNDCIDNLHHRLNQIYSVNVHDLSSKIIQLPPLESQCLTDKIENNFTLMTQKYGKFNRQASILIKYMNTAIVYKIVGYFMKRENNFNEHLMNANEYINLSIENYKKVLALMGSRVFDPETWDVINWELSELIYHKAIDYQNKLAFSSDPDKEKDVIKLLLEVLKYCDMENASTYQLSYQLRNAVIHLRLGYFYSRRLRSLKENTPQFRNSINQSILHHDSAFDEYFKINRLLDCLEVILCKLTFEIHLFENTATSKIKSILCIVDTLKKCILILPTILIGDYITNGLLKQNEDTSNHTFKQYLIDLETKLQFILKTMIKQAMLGPPNRLTDKLNILKKIYSDLLRKKDDIDSGTHILRIITQIAELSL